MFFLAKELGMTVAQLTKHLTQEELVGWPLTSTSITSNTKKQFKTPKLVLGRAQ